MKLLKLYIANYKKFTDQTFVFYSDNLNNSIQHDLFAKMNITLLSGENGSGKSTVLSFISIIFRYLQRYRERIPCDFILTYEINQNNTKVNIELSKTQNLFGINIDGQLHFIQNFDLKSRRYIPYENSEIDHIHKYKHIEYKQTTYDNIMKYLPDNICIIGFDTDYETIPYNIKYVGHRIIDYRDISESYKSSDFGSNYSAGVLHTYYKFYNDKRLVSVFRNMGISFSPFIDIYLNFTENDYKQYQKKNFIKRSHFNKAFWEKYIVSSKDINYSFNIQKFLLLEHSYDILMFFIQNRMIFINEFYIIKGKDVISLSGMSTGEKIFLSHLFFVSSRINDNSLIIWEEPETHLNRMWSKQLIPLLCILFSDYDFQLLISSHDTTLINSLFPNQIIILTSKLMNVTNPNFNTFLANDVEIENNLFKTSSGYHYFEEYIIFLINNSDQENLKVLLDSLGNSFLKLLLYNKMNE